ncbi:hypothetical protein ARMSODRAFT_1048358 [Armillaria solidipes]|uniref:Uncharacterized protein n=1 Tax=Armillaria solidipes TaxID=1076256 RepID=A0A2H3BH83_9AGAR|nr:hypothetical protein ARMSODRAFT_1048358 [Armillaria solidipes]
MHHVDGRFAPLLGVATLKDMLNTCAPSTCIDTLGLMDSVSMLITHGSKGEPDSNLQYVPSKFRPFVASAIRRLFPGDGSAELEPDLTDGVPGVRKLKRRLRSESKANYRRRKEIERLNERLRIVEDRDQRAQDDRVASLRENSRLRDQLRSERQRDPWEEQRHQKAKDDLAACRCENYHLSDQIDQLRSSDQWEELDPNLKVVFVIGCITSVVMTICVMVIAFKVIRKIPFKTLFDWCMIFLHTMYRLWVEIAYPLLLELLEHYSNPGSTEDDSGHLVAIEFDDDLGKR